MVLLLETETSQGRPEGALPRVRIGEAVNLWEEGLSDTLKGLRSKI